VVATGNIREYTISASDGWISMPRQVKPVAPYFPDPFAPPTLNPNNLKQQSDSGGMEKFTTFIFGFRDVSTLADNTIAAQKGRAQLSAPIMHMQVGDDFRVTLRNLGYGWSSQNPDPHTIHFHGFENQIAYFDGVPEPSLSVPPQSRLTYRYLPEGPGTYMWHCHVDDVEHVNMGLYGLVFVSPKDAPNLPKGGSRYAYEDPSTYFDRQFPIMISELFQQGHFNDRHLNDTDWTEYNGTFRLMNGRAWPDTTAPSVDPLTGQQIKMADPASATTPTYDYRLQFQPNSSLIEGEVGEKILIRLSNLGFEEHSLVLPGLPATIIGRDAKYQGAGRPDYDVWVDPGTVYPPGSRGSAETTGYRIDIGPGESRDVLVDLSAVTIPGERNYVEFPFYDRNYGYDNGASNSDNAGSGSVSSYGGQRTLVRVFKKGLLGPQTAYNDPQKRLFGDPSTAGLTSTSTILPTMIPPTSGNN